jgi:hypothetical protein
MQRYAPTFILCGRAQAHESKRINPTFPRFENSRNVETNPAGRRSCVSWILSRWSGGRWTFTHGVGDHGLGDPFYEFGGHGHEQEARVELGLVPFRVLR